MLKNSIAHIQFNANAFLVLFIICFFSRPPPSSLCLPAHAATLKSLAPERDLTRPQPLSVILKSNEAAAFFGLGELSQSLKSEQVSGSAVDSEGSCFLFMILLFFIFQFFLFYSFPLHPQRRKGVPDPDFWKTVALLFLVTAVLVHGLRAAGVL